MDRGCLGINEMLRLRPACTFRNFAILTVFSFVWLQLWIFNFEPRESRASDHDVPETAPRNIAMLSQVVQRVNTAQHIRNSEEFGPLGENDVIIVIQVHNRAQYLHALIESLRRAQDIDGTLLIFSHDLFHDRINALIRKIDFAKVMQIFYPKSIQLHPNEFPGHDPKDCPQNITKKEALNISCNNAKYPDLYGHYREAKFSQTKHHWWWKVNHVMDGSRVTAHHRGPVLFVEEDNYVAPDFLYILRMMENLKITRYPQCNMLCLGRYAKSYSYADFSSKIEIVKWDTWNMGIVINRTMWNQIKKCAKAFCTFDDYNWDWSLHHVSATCLPAPLTAMVAIAPRMFHIGKCGVHHKTKNCSSHRVVEQVARFLRSSGRHLFPRSLQVRRIFRKPLKTPKPFGGWGDRRDRALCCSEVNYSGGDCV